ncbi:MAG: C-GCAxxG-C-C family protein [Chloroflexota bacterium]
MGNKESFKAFSPLAGGIARQGETCGAIIGALAALGLVIGREEIQDTDTYRKAMTPAAEIYQCFRKEIKKEFAFKEALRGTTCRHLHKRLYGRVFDLTKPEEFQAFLDAGGHSDKGCPKVCAIAARVAGEMLVKLIPN